ncbi:MAG: hypothetical protein KTR21_12075 [Rhodobacteraceae bacterium]|nr:hypothetical protein [Paracoccaceae bacterium]
MIEIFAMGLACAATALSFLYVWERKERQRLSQLLGPRDKEERRLKKEIATLKRTASTLSEKLEAREATVGRVMRETQEIIDALKDRRVLTEHAQDFYAGTLRDLADKTGERLRMIGSLLDESEELKQICFAELTRTNLFDRKQRFEIFHAKARNTELALGELLAQTRDSLAVLDELVDRSEAGMLAPAFDQAHVANLVEVVDELENEHAQKAIKELEKRVRRFDRKRLLALRDALLTSPEERAIAQHARDQKTPVVVPKSRETEQQEARKQAS